MKDSTYIIHCYKLQGLNLQLPPLLQKKSAMIKETKILRKMA